MPGPSSQHKRRVGTVRPSHLMFTSGVGALIDLPNFPVLIRGLDDWRYDTLPSWEALNEPRLLRAVGRMLNAPVEQLRPAPWMDGFDDDPNGPAARAGVPVVPFPQWLRCTACNRLAPLDSQSTWGFLNDQPRRPDEAKFFHHDCPTRKWKPLAVAARFVLACTNGHLDDFPYREFVHVGGVCPEASHPALSMEDYGGNRGANVMIRCLACRAKRNMNRAIGRRGEENLPRCRGRHPHLSVFDPDCDAQPMVVITGASNLWFAQTMSALAVPETGATELQTRVTQLWEQLQVVTGEAVLDAFLSLPQFQVLQRWKRDDIMGAINAHRARLAGGGDEESPDLDLLTPEWEVFTEHPGPDPTEDFAIYRPSAGVPSALTAVFSDLVQVERLREVRALAGFTRLDAPDPDDPELVKRVRLNRDGRPTWVPASEVRGEGIFLQVAEPVIAAWEERVADSRVVEVHRHAFGEFRHKRWSDRLPRDFDPYYGWPGARYIALHTLSHLLIREIALEAGYNSASLAERIYSGEDRAGILIYTAVPDAEGTLGGLVSLGEPASLTRLYQHAVAGALRCSSDPLCAERLPIDDILHGAACHACLFLSETTCERGNRFLDRRFVVPVDDEFPALVIP